MKTAMEKTEQRAIPHRDIGATSDAQDPVSIKTILVPLDFSRASMQAVSYAVSFAKKFGAAIHLLHVEAPDEACAVAGAGQVMRETAESVAALHERLAGIQRKHVRAFWPENCHIRTGRPHEQICELARELNVDLIVLASRGNTGLRRVVLGSTAERVVRFSSCPVLVVRQCRRKGNAALGLITSGKKFSIRKILAPVDFSQCSVAGAMYAAFLSKTFGAKLCLFHSFQPPPPVVVDRVSTSLSSTEGLNLKNARLDMEAFRKLDFLRDVKCTVEIRTGYPIDEICGESERT